MPTPFDFEAFISGADQNLPRFEVPLYRVVHQKQIDDLETRIKKAGEAPAADERESSTGVADLITKRDALKQAQEDSAQWIELRALSAREYADLPEGEDTLLDQIAAQSKGTRNEADRDRWKQIQAAALPGAWHLFASRANQIVLETMVMPDFSPSDSPTRSPGGPSKS